MFISSPLSSVDSASQSVISTGYEAPREVKLQIIPDTVFTDTSHSNQSTMIIEKKTEQTEYKVFDVPFYSQFTDITPVEWKKVGCGIASLAMLVNFYKPGSVSADELLQDGITTGAYLTDAGWSHAGLINVSKRFGLDGESCSLADLSMTEAFSELEKVVAEGPVMVSVHYTFEPTNPIPHLVVINGVRDGKVFYNDPAEGGGGNSLSVEKFKNAWKKRYILIRPV